MGLSTDSHPSRRHPREKQGLKPIQNTRMGLSSDLQTSILPQSSALAPWV